MDKILTNNIWEQVSKEILNCKKAAAIAYVTSNEYVQFEKGDILICDASERIISSAGTDAKVLRKYFENGAEIYHYPNLHAKVIVFENKALIGSNNLTINSANLTEAALLTDRTQILSQINSLIYQIKSDAVKIDEKFLKRIEKIKVVRNTKPSQRKSKQKEIKLNNRCWIVSTRALSKNQFSKEKQHVEDAKKQIKSTNNIFENINLLRWTGNSRFRKLAMEGDTFIQVHRETESRVSVYGPYSILKRQDKDHWTRFYYEDKDNEGINWTVFQKKIKSIGLRKTISKTSVMELTSLELSAIEEAALS